MNTTIPDFSVIIPYKINGIVSLIRQRKNFPFVDAVGYLYNAELYRNLSDETSKLWHLSPHKLFDLLEDEYENGKFQFPDFV
ncbi:MAG: hypothetical protein P1P88_11380 [Bacteroidales bacterium]|nr:hypothetical protein [Bacteroidales bacterium]